MSADDQDMTHTHLWGPERFRDFCHYILVERTCKACPAVLKTGQARDFDLNPLQIAFADPSCERCRHELRGKEPASWAALSSGGNDAQPSERGRAA